MKLIAAMAPAISNKVIGIDKEHSIIVITML